MRCFQCAAIVLMALSMTAAPGVAWTDEAEDEYVETIDVTYPMNADGDLEVENTNGSFQLTTWDKNEVHIVAEKRMRLDDGTVSWLLRLIGIRGDDVKTDEDAKKLFEQLNVEVTGTEARREVNTIYPENTHGIQFNVAYTITAPKGVKLRVQTTNGAIRVDDVAGRVDVQSTNGSITLDDVSGAAEARSTNGRIEIEDGGGAIIARTTNGSVNVRTAHDLSGISEIQARSVNGSVRLALPEGLHFDLSAGTVHGSVTSDYELDSVRAQSRKELEGRAGDGGPRVELETTNGSVRITKLD